MTVRIHPIAVCAADSAACPAAAIRVWEKSREIWSSTRVPIDGSDIALHSVAWIVRHVAEYREPPHIHLINVQATLPNDIGRFINAETLREFHFEAGMAALSPARDQLAGSPEGRGNCLQSAGRHWRSYWA